MREKRNHYPGRWPIYRLMDFIISVLPGPKVKRGVAIIRQFGIGDALIFRALLDEYLEALGVTKDEVTLIGSPSWKVIAPTFFGSYNVVFIDERRFVRSLLYRFRMMLWMHNQGFKKAVCGMRFRYPHAMDSLLVASGADETIALEQWANPKFSGIIAHYEKRISSTVRIDRSRDQVWTAALPVAQITPHMHEIEYQRAFLSRLSHRPSRSAPPVPLSIEPRVLPYGLGGKRYAVLNIGASFPARRWPLDKHMQLVKELLTRGDFDVVLLGGPAEQSMVKDVDSAVETLRKDVQIDRLHVAINILSFPDVTSLIAQASLVVSCDTGLGHLAILLSRPSVLVIGGGHYGEFMPYPTALTPSCVRFVYQLMPCTHCNWACKMDYVDTFPCMAGVALDAVWRACQDVIES